MGKKRCITIILGLIAVFVSAQQDEQEYVKNPCGTMIADSIRRARHPEIGTLNQFEGWFQQKVEETKNNNQSAKKQVTYTLPVVFHVIHDGDTVGGDENISDAQIQSQIDVLNLTFRKQNTDINRLSLPPYVNNNWASTAADCEINFCLTKADINGNAMPSPGIDRINASSLGLSTITPYDIAYIDEVIKPQTIWNPNKYLNIWIVKSIVSGPAEGILGYAAFPVNSTLPGIEGLLGTLTTDGVVLVYDVIGTTGTLQSRYKKGRTAVHEVGHWLGLRHVWGDVDCGDDYCDDTPTQQEASTKCSGYPNITCNNGPYGNNFFNFMDYSGDNCMIMFTYDQKTRMHTAMTNCPFRVSLANQSCEVPEEIESPQALIISPNPTEGEVFISSSNPIAEIKIYNLLGKTMLQSTGNNSNNLKVDLVGYSSGIYFVEVNDGFERVVQKIVVNAK